MSVTPILAMLLPRANFAARVQRLISPSLPQDTPARGADTTPDPWIRSWPIHFGAGDWLVLGTPIDQNKAVSVLQAIEREGADALVGALWSDRLGELRTLFIDIGTQAEDVVSQSVRLRINHEVQGLLGRPGQDILVEAELPLGLGLVTRHSPATVWPSLMLLRKVVELLEPTVAWETTVENLDFRATYRKTGRLDYGMKFFQLEEVPWRDMRRTVVLGAALRERLGLLSPEAKHLPDIYAWFVDGPMLWLMGPDTFEMTYATVHVQVAGPQGPFLMSFDDPWMGELLYETEQRHRKALQDLLRPLSEQQRSDR